MWKSEAQRSHPPNTLDNNKPLKKHKNVMDKFYFIFKVTHLHQKPVRKGVRSESSYLEICTATLYKTADFFLWMFNLVKTLNNVFWRRGLISFA